MRKLNEILYVTEDTSVSPTRWSISFRNPEFQGGDSEDISKEDATLILQVMDGQKNQGIVIGDLPMTSDFR